jgi:hypothetical protein
VSRINSRGQWRRLHGGKQYRTDAGAVLNRWAKSGTTSFQGREPAAQKFGRRFKAIAPKKDRLAGEPAKSVEDLRKENEIFERVIVDALLEGGRLKKAASKAVIDLGSTRPALAEGKSANVSVVVIKDSNMGRTLGRNHCQAESTMDHRLDKQKGAEDKVTAA